MTERQAHTEYGVEYTSENRRFVAAGYTRAGARDMVAHGAGFEPRPVRVMRREVGGWEPDDESPA